MHPIERLRYVARASGADQAALVRETAQALATFRADPPGLVTACRRIVSRQPASGALWWLCGRTLCAGDAMVEAWKAADEVEADVTPRELAHALPDDATVCVLGWPEQIGQALLRRGDVEVLVVDTLHEGSGLVSRLLYAETHAADVPLAGLGAAVVDSDLLLLEATAVGPDAFVGVAGSLAAASVAHHAGVPVWLAAGVGRLLPGSVWQHVAARVAASDPWDADDEVVPLDLVDSIAGPAGVDSVEVGLRRTDCPVAPELFREL